MYINVQTHTYIPTYTYTHLCVHMKYAYMYRYKHRHMHTLEFTQIQPIPLQHHRVHSSFPPFHICTFFPNSEKPGSGFPRCIYYLLNPPYVVNLLIPPGCLFTTSLCRPSPYKAPNPLKYSSVWAPSSVHLPSHPPWKEEKNGGKERGREEERKERGRSGQNSYLHSALSFPHPRLFPISLNSTTTIQMLENMEVLLDSSLLLHHIFLNVT